MRNELSERIDFKSADWRAIPASPGVYVIFDRDEVVYVGMAGRNGKSSLRNRLRDHAPIETFHSVGCRFVHS